MPPRLSLPEPPRPFEWVGNHPALDFTNTVSWRSTGPENERFEDYRHLLRWTLDARLLDRSQIGALAESAGQDPARAEAVLRLAVELRAVLHDLLQDMARSRTPSPATIEGFNAFLAEALAHVCLTCGKECGTIWWRGLEEDLGGVLWPIVWSASGLLTSDQVRQIGVCANDECRWLFLDTSPSRRRRWCVMKDCGNRAKVRRHRQRSRGKPTPAV